MKMFTLSLILCQEPWVVTTYPDEKGFQYRTTGMVQKLAQMEYAEKSKAESTCPDTDLTVRLWALEGEEIISPYTGRRYIQGPTGYFGPKERDEEGRIIRFGGDPLKRDLPPATAVLLSEPQNIKARAYLSIPGNLNQQYHFAAKNWARFYPLLADTMGEEWKNNFCRAVAEYEEKRRPSDGVREYAKAIDPPHNLVGETGQLLGGNMKNGGTENHKTMWRTSGLLYAQLFPEGAMISGYPKDEAEEKITMMLRDYLQRIFITGNGEYDSQIYYPHSIEGFLNLFDFSPNQETRQMAQVALDYYLAGAGLKVMDGTIAGAQKRGYINKPFDVDELEAMFWAWSGNSSKIQDPSGVTLTIQQATTSYRPNKIIYNILNKNIPLPFEAYMTRPSYHMNIPNAFQETFYCSETFALGSVAMTMVDNPTQQVVWSLVVKGTDMPLCFSGGHPMHGTPTGHSPYTQTMQKRGAIIVLSGDSRFPENAELSKEQERRLQYASEKRIPLSVPNNHDAESIKAIFKNAPKSQSTWLFIPKNIDRLIVHDEAIFIKANQTYIVIVPVGGSYDWIKVDPRLPALQEENNRKTGNLRFFDIMVIHGPCSGFILDADESKHYQDFSEFISAWNEKANVNTCRLENESIVGYQSLHNDELVMKYDHTSLRALGSINGKKVEYKKWADGYAYKSPYLQIKNGKMKVSDGTDAYVVDYRDEEPVFRVIKPW